ncbi:hypothetical protein BPIT_35690 [Candidatus Brocadia pituitae]|nr:hypothetical protein BPIT_35690 [Candidatus Brocadia pituitae]
MRTIKTLLHVEKDHTVNIKIKLPKEVAPGNYSALVVMDEKSHEKGTGGKKTFECLSWDWDAWPKSCSFRREDIYDEEGR